MQGEHAVLTEEYLALTEEKQKVEQENDELHNEIQNLNTEISQLLASKESTPEIEHDNTKSIFDLPAINSNEKYWFDHSDQYDSDCFIDINGIEHYTGFQIINFLAEQIL